MYFNADMKLRPLDSQAWEIYSDLEGAELAAHNMVGAVEKALRLLAENVSEGSDILTAARKAYRHADAALENYEEYGALDAEPLNVLVQIIEEFARRRFGADIDLRREV